MTFPLGSEGKGDGGPQRNEQKDRKVSRGWKHTPVVFVKQPSNFLSHEKRALALRSLLMSPQRDHLASCIFEGIPYEVPRSTQDIVSTKIFDLNPIKLLDVTFKLQEI